MKAWPFTKGLHDLGNGCYAYLQPAGTWGLSNAALVVDGDEVLLIDTLMDLKLSAEMLETLMQRAVPTTPRTSNTLVNRTDDHFFGNQLVEGATIIASAAAKSRRESGGAHRHVNQPPATTQRRVIWI